MIDSLPFKEAVEQLLKENKIENKKLLKGLTDVIAQQSAAWNESLHGYETETGLRLLPRLADGTFSNTFKTEKHTYTIYSGAKLGHKRFTAFNKVATATATGRTFDKQIQEIQKVMQVILTQNDIGELRRQSTIRLQALCDSISSFSKEQIDMALHLATVYVCREDEDLTVYDENLALEKMEDWAGFVIEDFFLLSITLIPKFAQYLKLIWERDAAAKQEFLDAIDTITKGETLHAPTTE